MCTVSEPNKSINPIQIYFHRDDFKKKFWIVKYLISLEICFNIVSISDTFDTRLFLLDPSYMNQVKAMLTLRGIKNSKRKVNEETKTVFFNCNELKKELI